MRRLSALLLMAPALVTLSVMVRDIEPSDLLSRVGLLVGAAGMGLLSAAGLAQASLEDVTWMPVIVILGLLSSLAGRCLHPRPVARTSPPAMGDEPAARRLPPGSDRE